MELLAQAVEVSPDWYTTIKNDGPLWGFFLIALWLAVQYGPSIARGHIALLNTSTENSNKLTTCFETLTESMSHSSNGHQKTHNALGHIADAHREAATNEKVIRHLDLAAQELKK